MGDILGQDSAVGIRNLGKKLFHHEIYHHEFVDIEEEVEVYSIPMIRI